MHNHAAPSTQRKAVDEDQVRGVVTDLPPAPPQTLARWAAIAGGLSYPGFLPRQADSRI